jgi:hypothetical protein
MRRLSGKPLARRSFDKMNPIERAFERLRGKPCWGVRSGTGTFLTLEFGTPRLVIREPRTPSPSSSRKVRTLLGRRGVIVRGRWHLWVTYCEWSVTVGGRTVGDSSSYRRKEAAVRVLNGQRLLAVQTNARGARTRFTFDLGAELETRPYNRTYDQWVLFGPNGHLVWRADRRFAFSRGGPIRVSQWRKLAG